MRFVRLWLPVLLWSAVILSASNPHFSAAETATWLDRLFGPGVPEWANTAMRKSGHVLAYGLLGVLAWRARRTLLAALFVVLLVAATDEINQARFPSRGGSPWDVLLDLGGAAVAIATHRTFSSRRP